MKSPLYIATSALLFLLFVPLWISGCAGQGRLKADLSKIRAWNEELGRTEPLPPPYVVDFESGAKALTLLSLESGNDARSPGFKLLSSVMEQRRYSVVILEEFQRSLGLSPATQKALAEKDGADGFYREGENALAIQRALKRGVPFVGGEPEEQLILDAMGEAGFMVYDLFCYYLIRLIPQWKRDGTLGRLTFEEAFAEASHKISVRLGLRKNQEPDLAFFQSWFEQKAGKPFRLREVNASYVAPILAGPLFTQKIAAVASRVRNEHLVRVTEEMLNRYGRVLVVFGSRNYPVQRLALESMLGAPVRISDQP